MEQNSLSLVSLNSMRESKTHWTPGRESNDFLNKYFLGKSTLILATVTMVLLPPFTRDPMVFVIPRINFHHSWDYKTTSLNWISLVMKVDTRDYKNHWIPRRVVIISQWSAAYKKLDALVCVSDVGCTRGSAHSYGHGLDEGLVPLDSAPSPPVVVHVVIRVAKG